MYVNELSTVKTIRVHPGVAVMGDLSKGGVLRFERTGSAMSGKPELSVRDGALVVHYEDGTTLNVQV